MIAAGLVTGAVAGAVLVGAAVLLVARGRPRPFRRRSPRRPSRRAPTASPLQSAPSSRAVAIASGAASPAASVSPGEAFGVGEPAPPLTVAALGGGEIALSALKGKPVWVNFMATWCEPCRDEIPRMNALRGALRGHRAWWSWRSTCARTRPSSTRSHGSSRSRSRSAWTRTATAQSDWGAYALPVHFWIDADGIVRYGALGGIGPDIMAEGLQTILPGVTVTP